MSDLIDYFVHHYALVLDNNADTHDMVRDCVRAAVTDQEPGLTYAAWRAMPGEERRYRFAHWIGNYVLSLLEELTIDVRLRKGIGPSIVNEIMIFSGADMSYALGVNYMPEDSDIEEWFPADAEDNA